MISKTNKHHWRTRQHEDFYFKLSKQQGFRTRSIYKLIEMNEKYRLIKPKSWVLDLGCSPGGWSEYIVNELSNKGRVVSVDVSAMKPITNVDFILGDFQNESIQNEILKKILGKRFDLIVSDISPNKTGNSITDQYHFFQIADEILEFSKKALKSKGSLVMKVFVGLGFEKFVKDSKLIFRDTIFFKPKSSKPKSKETYLIASSIRL
ncbi:MAG TPA: RlmE family RNA methyltransferase [Gammaproteobacteria bacterium]|nr:RlmE family RNA methyltransferase [Gammaproteobacteria bacterium]